MVYLPVEIIENIISFLGGEKYNIELNNKKTMQLVVTQGNLHLKKMMIKDVLRTITSQFHIQIIKKVQGKLGLMDRMNSFLELYIYLPTHTLPKGEKSLRTVSPYFFNLIFVPRRNNTYLLNIVIAKNHDHKFSFKKDVIKNDDIFLKLNNTNSMFEFSQELCVYTPESSTFLINGKTLSLRDPEFLNELYQRLYYYVYGFYSKVL
jgi:hypothetical protein